MISRKILIKVHVHINGEYDQDLYTWVPIHFTFNDIKNIMHKKLIRKDYIDYEMNIYMSNIELSYKLNSIKIHDYFAAIPRSIELDCYLHKKNKSMFTSFYENWIEYYICKRK